MNTVVLFVKGGVEWSPEKWIVDKGGKEINTGQFVLETAMAWISITRHDAVLDDYDDIEKEHVFNYIRNPSSYLIEWKGDKLLTALIVELPSICEGVIDNDHGLICSVSKLKGISLSSWVTRENKGSRTRGRSLMPLPVVNQVIE